MAEQTPQKSRLVGIDIARALAFLGMIVVNFGIVVGVPEGTIALFDFLAGKAAASFVMIAGLGIGLSSLTSGALVRRATVLFLFGLVNLLIFEGDIIHFYAVYFLIAACVLNWRPKGLSALALAIVVVATIAIITLDFDRGWDWDTLTYLDLWTGAGFLRNLLYNGWTPVFPWVAFLLIGLAISRGLMARPKRMVLLGGAMMAIAESARFVVTPFTNPDLHILFLTGPVPALPVYMLTGTGAGFFLIGFCLLTGPNLGRVGAALARVGQQSLTLYFAHILIGMGLLDALGYLNSARVDVALATIISFFAASLIYTTIWPHRGPMEMLLRWAERLGQGRRLT